MKRWARIGLWVFGSLFAVFAAADLAHRTLSPPWGKCLRIDYTVDLPPAPLPGTPQQEAAKRALAYAQASEAVRKDPDVIKNAIVYVEDKNDHWQVVFNRPSRRTFLGCVVSTQDGDGPRVLVKKADLAPYRIVFGW